MLRNFIGEESRDKGADECDRVDGDGHVLCLDSIRVAQTVDEGRVEVGKGGRADNDLRVC